MDEWWVFVFHIVSCVCLCEREWGLGHIHNEQIMVTSLSYECLKEEKSVALIQGSRDVQAQQDATRLHLMKQR